MYHLPEPEHGYRTMSDEYPHHTRKTNIHTWELIRVKEAAKEHGREPFKSKDLTPYCDFSAKQIGRRLATLEDNGVVEKMNAQSPYTWKVVK